MSLLSAGYGDSSAAGMPRSPYKKNFDGSFAKGLDGRWALDGPDGSIQYTSVSPEEYIVRTGDRSLVDGNTGGLPDGNAMFQDNRPSFDTYSGQHTTWKGDTGYARPFDPTMDDPRNAPKPDPTRPAPLLPFDIPMVSAGVGFGGGAPVGPYLGNNRPVGNQDTNAMVSGAILPDPVGPYTPNPRPDLPPLSIGMPGQSDPGLQTNTQGPSQIDLRGLGSGPSTIGRTSVPLTADQWNAAARGVYGGKTYDQRSYDEQAAIEKTLGAAPAAAGGVNWGNVAGAVAPLAGAAIGAGGSIIAANKIAEGEKAAADANAAAADKAGGLAKTIYDQTRADLTPWREDGTAAVKALGSFETDNPMSAFNMNDPGFQKAYAFRFDEGLKALENSMSARGGLFSGNTMKAMQKYGQDMASEEYLNSYNRFRSERGEKRNALENRAGLGQTTNQHLTSAGQNYGNVAGNAMVGAAAARGEGITGAAAANASMYTGGANALTSAISGAYNNWQRNALMDRYDKMMGGY